MDQSLEILSYLNGLGIHCTLFEHEPKTTIEACQNIEGINWSTSAMCKNVFLSNRQETQFYLMLLRHDRPFKTALVSKLLGVSRLSFARQELLPDMLLLDPGAVNPLSLIYDRKGRVQLAIDRALCGYEYLLFHPGVNFKSVRMKSDDFFNVFLPACGRSASILTLSES